MNNILTAIFEDNKYCHVSGLWQYDYGQVLRIQGLNLPKAVEIHFSLTESSGDSITRIGTTKDGATDVIIPDSMLENGDTGQNYNIYAFIFLSEIDSGNTEYRIKISVKARPKPEIPGTPEEPELFRETINAVNDAADRAETAERNAKVSEEAAAEHAKKTESSVTELDTAKEKALKAIDDKKAEGVNAVVKQKETSEQSVTEHTDREIQRVTQKANEINNSLNKSITEASNKKSALDESVNTSVETKKQLNLSIESGKIMKAELDQSIEDSTNAKSNLDGSVTEANTIKTELAEAVETASTLDGSLGTKIEEGKQVEKNIVASGEKAVEDINTTGAEKLKVMQDIAEEFAADREQIDINQNNISSLKENLGDLSESKISKFYVSNQGEIHLADSDNGKIMDMMLYGKSSQDGTPTPDNPVEIKSVVNPKVEVLNENGTESQIVTIPYTLNAIPVSSGGNVTIGEQQYISDYVDVEKGKLYRKVKRLNLKDVDDIRIAHGFHSNGNGYLSISAGDIKKGPKPISNRYKSSAWTDKSGYTYIPSSNGIIFVDDRFTDRQTAIKLVQDTYVIYALSSQIEEDLSLKQIKSLKSLSTNYPVTNITVGSEEVDGYAVFNYPVSMANGWNYVKQQLNDNRDYIYDMDLQSAEAYVNSEYAVTLTELEA